MRILLVHSGSDLYGASRSLLRLATGLLRKGHAVHVVLPSEGPLCSALQSERVSFVVERDLPLITRRGFSTPWGLLAFAWKAARCVRTMRSIIDRFQPDLVHTNNTTVWASYATDLARQGIPHVWHVRESFAEFRGLWPHMRRRILRSADRVVCVSSAVARQFGDHPRVEVLHNGFPPAEFERVTAADVAAFRERWGTTGLLTVGIAGRLKLKRKGQEVFLRAASSLARTFPDVRFLLIGSAFPGNETHEDALRSLAQSLGISDRVIFTGDVDQPLVALKSLDVVVLASGLPEPFGGVVIEAMALGRPVVGTAIGGTPEQIVDGVTGRLVPPDNPGQMADAIACLLRDEDLREHMGKAAQERYRACFTFDTFLARIEALYQTLCPASAVQPPAQATIVGTRCTILSGLDRFRGLLERHRKEGHRPLAIDFTNVHIVTERRLNPDFRALTRAMDVFVPDSGVLCRSLRLLGAAEPACLFGPHVMDNLLSHSPAGATHALLGGSETCIERLRERYGKHARIVFAHHGYGEAAQGDALAREIADLNPDFVWIGLGTPRQQAWIARHKSLFHRSILLAVGYAFDVNAGLKSDAPAWVHRARLVWLYRLLQEPRRLVGRYAYYNTAFLLLFARQWICGPHAVRAETPR